MKKTLKIVLCVVLFVLVILVIRIHTIPKPKVEPNIYKSELLILRKQEETHMNYMCVMNDVHAVHNFLMRQEWKKSEYAYLKSWIYGVTITSTLTTDGYEGDWVTTNTNDDEQICKIYLYDDCIEINGIFYEPDNYSEIYNYFENYYMECTNNYPVYTIER